MNSARSAYLMACANAGILNVCAEIMDRAASRMVETRSGSIACDESLTAKPGRPNDTLSNPTSNARETRR